MDDINVDFTTDWVILKLQEGLAFGALLIAMCLAFFLNRAGKPIWFSLLLGVAIGLAVYFVSAGLKNRGKKQ